MVDSTFYTEANKVNSKKVLLSFIDISHSDITTLRFVNNTESITRNGNSYYKFNFGINLPEDVDYKMPQVNLQIENVDRQIITALETIDKQEELTVTLNLAFSDSPNTTQRGPYTFRVKNAQVTQQFATFTLGYEDKLNNKFPKNEITPEYFPGMF